MRVNYFTFKKWAKGYLITNEMGKFLFLEDDEFEKIVQGQFHDLPTDLLQQLKKAYFIVCILGLKPSPYRRNL